MKTNQRRARAARVWMVVAAVCVGGTLAGAALAQDAGAPVSPPVNPPVGATPASPVPGSTPKAEEARLTAGLLGGMPLRSIGPALYSGRISDFAVTPGKPWEYYVAVSCGNVWKTVNGGATFTPVFEGYGSYSIGVVTQDPSNPHVVWVGTGENNSQRSVGWGDGVYVSRDAGKSFTHAGLKESEHIGSIVVDPRDSNVVYVAAQGPLWRSGGERGLYKTTDGGATWTRVLHVSDEAGVNEVHLDPRNPDVLYASAYQRRRHVWTLINGGPESAIYKSTDAGATWRKVDKGLPGVDKGRIGLAVSPANPDIVYAIVEAADGEGGIFRSRDRGESWEKRSSYMTSSPQYYNELVADPKNPDRFYTMDTFMHVTDDGGATMVRVPIPDVHVDFHALWINPENTDHLLAGTDGGMYETFDRANWRFYTNLPVTQFYKVAVDTSKPFYYVYGGTQDNNTLGGPSRTIDRIGIASEAWFVTVGGDGFEPAIDPDDPNIVYSQWQYGGLVRYDRRTMETVDIRPREKAGDAPFVWNWDSALLISPHHGRRVYFGSRVLHRSDDRGDTWTTISPDLTRGVDRNQLQVMEVVQKPDAVAKHMSTSIYGNIVALTESPLVEGLLYVGTDDGLVQVTEDGGKTWRKVERVPGVPEMTYVSDLEASRHDPDRVYATFNNHKMGDFTPYVLRSDDRGRTWASVAGDLPARHAAWAIAEDHVTAELLFVGTEFGVFASVDAGQRWLKLAGVPTQAVRDVEIQRRENDLVIATFGRGFYILDDYTPLRTLREDLLAKDAVLFAPRPALSYIETSRLGGTTGRGFLGGTHYSAKNPPFGAVFTYALKEKVMSRRERRKEAEKQEGWVYPTIDALREEDRESEPQVLLVVRDGGGGIIRRIEVAREKGLHRAAWNLRYAASTPVSLAARGLNPWDVETDGTLVPPGTYAAHLATLVDGVETAIGETVAVVVVDADLSPLTVREEAREDKFDFERKLAGLQRAVEGAARVTDDVQNRLAHLEKGARATAGLEASVLRDLESLRRRLAEVRASLRGDPTLAKRAEPEPPSISERVSNAMYSLLFSTQAPTTTQREQYAIAGDEFERALAALRTLVEKDLAALEKKMEAAGTPWTPGRLPEWKR